MGRNNIIFLVALGFILILLGAATYFRAVVPQGVGLEVRESQELPPGIYCLDADLDGRADLIVFAPKPIRVLAQDSAGLGPCTVYNQPNVVVQARDWIIDANGGTVVIPAIREEGQ